MLMNISKGSLIITYHGGSHDSNTQSVTSPSSGNEVSTVNKGTKWTRDNQQSRNNGGKDDMPPKKKG